MASEPKSEQPGVRVTLIESDGRKAAFLREAARQTGVAVDIVCARIESDATHAKVGKSDVVSARALAPLGRLLEWAYPYFSSDSIGLFLKGREVETEIVSAKASFAFACQLQPSLTDPDGRVVVIRNLRVKSEG
jgi:16S rRNA (guanine527-N7)-methyltransferase